MIKLQIRIEGCDPVFCLGIFLAFVRERCNDMKLPEKTTAKDMKLNLKNVGGVVLLTGEILKMGASIVDVTGSCGRADENQHQHSAPMTFPSLYSISISSSCKI